MTSDRLETIVGLAVVALAVLMPILWLIGSLVADLWNAKPTPRFVEQSDRGYADRLADPKHR